MRRISSQLTFFYKWGFPALWFGILASIFAVSIFNQSAGKGSSDWGYALVPILGPVAGGLLAGGAMRWFGF